MPRILTEQRNFNGGEIDTLLTARTEVDKYEGALTTATNSIVSSRGPIRRRNGSKFIAEVKDSTDETYLVRFQFSADDALVLEFGNLYIRFYESAGVVPDPIIPANPFEIVSPYTAVQARDIQYIQAGDLVYLVHSAVAPQLLTRIANDDWTIAAYADSPPATDELGEFPTTTVTPGAATGLGITFTAGAAVFLTSDIGRQIINLSGTGRASITALNAASPSATVTVDIVQDFPDTSAIASGSWFLDRSPIVSITPTGSAIGSVITIDAVADTFRSTDVGKFIIVANGVVEILTVATALQVTGEVLKSLTSIDATIIWTLEEQDWSVTRGFPRSVTIHQNRLTFGGTITKPATIWMSETGIFESLGRGAADSDAVIFSRGSNQIQWMAPTRDLNVGTTGDEYVVSSSGAAITPSDLETRGQTSRGGELQVPLLVDNEVLFIQRAGRKVRAAFFDFDRDGNTAEDLTYFIETLAGEIITRIAYAQEPDSNIYAITAQGNLLVGTYVREQQVLGWTRYTTEGSYEDVQTITVGGSDQVWVMVNRTIQSVTQRYVELFDDGDGTDAIDGFSDSYLSLSNPRIITVITQANPGVVTSTAHGFTNGQNIKIFEAVGMTEINNVTLTVANVAANTFELQDEDAVNLDTTGFGAYTGGGEAHLLVTTVSGLTHLEGETVQIKVDNAVHPDEVVSSGSITLDFPGAEVTVGLSYTTTITTLDEEFDIGLGGSIQGQRSRWVSPILRVFNSVPPTVSGNILPAREVNDFMDTAVPLETGELFYPSVGLANGAQLEFTLSAPFPLQILGLFGIVEGDAK